mmetsp:Transcript_9830/g.14967  ORF Transcript_9830/g.14967 Transcript_9830/m.14967 type:complete len:155 (+) Transcript_9830:114-578(+)
MQIKYVVKSSNVKGAGLGVFADEQVKKGQIVWKWYDRNHTLWYDKESLDKHLAYMPIEAAKKYLAHVYELANNCAVYEFDDGKYFNHSEDPNVYDFKTKNSYAIRDIAKGEELYDNYLSFPAIPWLLELFAKYHVWHINQPLKPDVNNTSQAKL